MIAQALEGTGKVEPVKTEKSPAKIETALVLKDVADTVAATANLKKLAEALKAADLVGALKGPGPFTLFAPTDEAFAKLPVGTLDGWLKPENKAKLAGILNYHAIAAKIGAMELAKEKTLKTVQGQLLTVVVEKGVVTLDGAKVTGKEIACGNGVIHLIDKVVEPKEAPAVEKPVVEEPAVEEPTDTE
ncbi:MAG: fasciclin domain-containing protein [Candidatus Coatesbacteria bacterium]|nr:fasciclin domain-containing protein [Candidatus Coatesbacteria bacterium]